MTPIPKLRSMSLKAQQERGMVRWDAAREEIV
jgi:hypothetical protein